MKYLLSFPDEAAMRNLLQPVPQSPYGVTIVRGAMGKPGRYADSGRVDEAGETIWTELEPPQPWPGYHAELIADALPPELEPYVSPHSAPVE